MVDLRAKTVTNPMLHWAAAVSRGKGSRPRGGIGVALLQLGRSLLAAEWG